MLRTPAVLPTGRNLHGFDPFRIPSAYAVQDGAKQAARLLERHMADGNALPESIAVVLWGTDNLKTEGGPIAQALALIGARPRFDSYGRLAGAELIPLAELGRPRVDVVVTLSGIFRDLLPLQIKLLAEAAYLARGSADEPGRAQLRAQACAGPPARAWLRPGDRGPARVRQRRGRLRLQRQPHDRERPLGRRGRARRDLQPPQELRLWPQRARRAAGGYCSTASWPASTWPTRTSNSVELGVTTVDHYFDTLGGISRAVRRAKGGEAAAVYIGDQTRGEGMVRTLGEQVALETRTRMLNPKWYEGMLKHGYEGVRQIETHVTNTMGWSATTGQVAPWVYQQLTQTFVLDDEMRERLAKLNPTASAKVANRLLEAHDRNYWSPDAATLEALRRAGEELEDRLEGIGVGMAA